MNTNAFPLSTSIFEILKTKEATLYLYLGASSTYQPLDGTYRCKVSIDQMCAALHMPRWRTRRILNNLIGENLVIAQEYLLPHLLPTITYEYHVVVI